MVQMYRAVRRLWSSRGAGGSWHCDGDRTFCTYGGQRNRQTVSNCLLMRSDLNRSFRDADKQQRLIRRPITQNKLINSNRANGGVVVNLRVRQSEQDTQPTSPTMTRRSNTPTRRRAKDAADGVSRNATVTEFTHLRKIKVYLTVVISYHQRISIGLGGHHDAPSLHIRRVGCYYLLNYLRRIRWSSEVLR